MSRIWYGMIWYDMVWYGMIWYVCMYVCMYVFSLVSRYIYMIIYVYKFKKIIYIELPASILRRIVQAQRSAQSLAREFCVDLQALRSQVGIALHRWIPANDTLLGSIKSVKLNPAKLPDALWEDFISYHARKDSTWLLLGWKLHRTAK